MCLVQLSLTRDILEADPNLSTCISGFLMLSLLRYVLGIHNTRTSICTRVLVHQDTGSFYRICQSIVQRKMHAIMPTPNLISLYC